MPHQPNKFWIVLKESDSRWMRHTEEATAVAEAERLSRKEVCGFYVLESHIKVRPLPQPPVELEWVATFPAALLERGESPRDFNENPRRAVRPV